MKKIILVLVFTLSLFSQGEVSKIITQNSNKDNITFAIQELTIEKRGCCSWHGGVKGCSGGRVTCNDGTYSPSCMCLGGQPISDIKTN